jgi:hypothetical protein
VAANSLFSIISLKSNWLHWQLTPFLLAFVAATWPCISAAGFVVVGVEVGKFV